MTFEVSQVGAGRRGVQQDLHPEDLETAGEVAQGVGEVLLARDLHRQAELAAELGRLLEERDDEAALGGTRRGRETGGTGADDGDRTRT